MIDATILTKASNTPSDREKQSLTRKGTLKTCVSGPLPVVCHSHLTKASNTPSDRDKQSSNPQEHTEDLRIWSSAGGLS
jgi:hypothetical protein